MVHNRAVHQVMSRAELVTVTLARIIDAARALADAAGDDAVRILDVAAAAQVSTGALYHHFAGREDLMTAVHLERYRGSLPEDLAFIDRLVDVDVRLDDVGQREPDGGFGLLDGAHVPAPIASRSPAVTLAWSSASR